MTSLRCSLVLAALALGCSDPVVSTDAGADAGLPPDAPTTDAPIDGGPPARCGEGPLPADVATAGTWDTSFTLAGLTGLDGFTPLVRDVAPAPDGSAIVVGYFTWAGSTRVEGIARLRDGLLTPIAEAASLPLATEGYAAAVVAADGSIVVAPYRRDDSRAGTFQRIAGGTVTAMGTFTGNVRSLVYVGDALWALGTLALADGGPQGAAIYEDGAWRAVPGGSPDGPAYELLEREGGELVVAGEFEHIGGIEAARVASLSGTTWTALDVPESARVLALAEDATGTLIAGGVFTLAEENLPSASLASWDGDSWSLIGGGVARGEATGVVADLVVDGNGVVAYGCFDHVGGNGGSAMRAEHVARLEAGDWTVLDDGSDYAFSHWYAPFVCGFEPAPSVVWEMPQQRMVRLGADLVIGGAFGGMGGVASQSVIAHDGDEFVALGTAGQGLSGTVTDLAVGGEGCEMHALINASHVGGVPNAAPVHVLGATGWRAVSSPLPEGARCNALAVDEAGTMFLGCDEEGMPPDFALRAYVLRSSDDGWERIGDVLETLILDVQMGPDDVAYVLTGTERGQLMRIDGDALVPVGDELDGLGLELTFAAREDGFDVIVGGSFMHAGDVEAQRIARWDGTAWSALGTGLATTPSALAAANGVVYAATHDEGTSGRLLLGRFDGTSWVDIATPANGLGRPFELTTHTFTSLEARGDVLLAAGSIWTEDGARSAFVYQDGMFRPLGGGVGALSVDVIEAGPDGIVVGGAIAEAGAGSDVVPSVGLARFRP